jgi:hypothetical protein
VLGDLAGTPSPEANAVSRNSPVGFAEHNSKGDTHVKISKNSLAIAAAFAGLVGGTAARAAQPLQTADSTLSAGMMADDKNHKPQGREARLQGPELM